MKFKLVWAPEGKTLAIVDVKGREGGAQDGAALGKESIK